MQANKQRENVFVAEQSILRAAFAELAEHDSPAPGEEGLWKRKYQELTGEYERLLKMAMKISRISDIQGRMLKEKEQEIRIANESMKELEQSRRHLIQDISHELRTPMTTAQGYVEALLDGVVEADERHLRMIHNRLLMLNRLLTDLFHLDTLKTNQVEFRFELMPLEEWIADVACKYSVDAAGRGIRLVAGGDAPTPAGLQAWVDPIRIEQVLSNMIHNALRFSPDGSLLHIGWERLDGEEVVRRYGSRMVGGSDLAAIAHASCYAVVRISDQGPGVEPEEVPRLFERFYRGAHPRRDGEKGTGLGLAIAKEIVLRHGGEIGAFPGSEGGSTFFFTLPVETDKAQIG